jgi:hypothetical protein
MYVRLDLIADATGTTWPDTSKVVYAGSSNVGRYATLLIVSSQPAIVFFNDATSSLMYIRATDVSGTTWPTTASAIPVIDADGGAFASATVVGGLPAVSYTSSTKAAGTNQLRYAIALTSTGSTWRTPVVVDGNATLKKQSSIGVANGTLCV